MKDQFRAHECVARIACCSVGATAPKSTADPGLSERKVGRHSSAYNLHQSRAGSALRQNPPPPPCRHGATTCRVPILHDLLDYRRQRMKITIHVGAHKTATTHLQAVCAATFNRPEENSILFAGPRITRSDEFPITRLAGVPDGSPQQTFLQRRLIGVLDGISAETLIVSDENLLGGVKLTKLIGEAGELYPFGPERLKRILSIPTLRYATIALAVRNPAHFLVSAYIMHVRGGGSSSLSDYTSILRSRKPLWSTLVDRLRHVSGIGHIVCWRYEDYALKQSKIIKSFSGGRLMEAANNIPPLNVSPSAQSLAKLVEVKNRNVRKAREQLIGSIRSMSIRSPGDILPCSLPKDLEREITDDYHRDIEMLRRLPDVTIL